MSASLVLTIIGPDRPGLVDAVARIIAAHDGNWEESRMAQLAGRFAGILRVSVEEARADPLASALRELGDRGLTVVVERSEGGATPAEHRRLRLEVMGTDHPGIVHDVSHALAERGVNVEELSSEVTSAPMTGNNMFNLQARVAAPPSVELDELREHLERIAADLMVDVSLVEGGD